MYTLYIRSRYTLSVSGARRLTWPREDGRYLEFGDLIKWHVLSMEVFEYCALRASLLIAETLVGIRFII